MPQLSNKDFLTTQTLCERFGLKQINQQEFNTTPIEPMKKDLYRQIDTLEDELHSALTIGIFLKVAVLGLLLVSLSEAAIIYFGGLLP